MDYAQNPKMLKLIKYLAMATFYWGACITGLGVIAIITDGGVRDGSILFGFFLIGVVPGGVGYFLLRHTNTLLKNMNSTSLENQILVLAKRKKGILTLADVMMDTKLPLEKSKELLESFTYKGLATPEVTDEGSIEYIFRDFVRSKS